MVIEVKNLSKYFNKGKENEVCAFREVSFELSAGDCMLLHGVSGSGKSTLLSVLACLSKPSSGEYFCLSEPVSRYNELFAAEFRRKNIGMIFQHFRLLKDLTVEENIILTLIPEYANISIREAQEKAASAAEKSGILHRFKSGVSTLSGGEMQRAALARALVNDPEIILADEPTAHLDRKNTDVFLDLMSSLKSRGKCIVVTSHDDYVKSSQIINKIYEMRHE
jgi:putative ABC transport system ATP-binding protein